MTLKRGQQRRFKRYDATVKEAARKQLNELKLVAGDSRLDSVWHTFKDDGLECSLVGRVDDELKVWYMVENDGAIHFDSRQYKKAEAEYKKLLERKRRKEGK